LYVRTLKGIHCKEHAPKAVACRTNLYKLKGASVKDPFGIEKNTCQQFGMIRVELDHMVKG